MTTPVPSTDELRAFCLQLVEAAWAAQRPPWRRWPVDDGAELLIRLAAHNITGPRWQRLHRVRAAVAHQGWMPYVTVIAHMIETHYDHVLALTSNDPLVWRALYRDIRAQVVRYLTRYQVPWRRAQVDSEDIAQTMCLKLLVVLTRYPWDVDFVAWLTIVAQHLTIDLLRHHEALDASLPYDIEMLYESTEESPFDVHPTDRLRVAFHDRDHLLFDEAMTEALTCVTSPWQRQVFVECRLRDKSLADAALELHTTYGAVASALLRAEQRLRLFIADHPDHFEP
jgi:RNA polymerase sigma factor (sigma-70 family)